MSSGEKFTYLRLKMGVGPIDFEINDFGPYKGYFVDKDCFMSPRSSDRYLAVLQAYQTRFGVFFSWRARTCNTSVYCFDYLPLLPCRYFPLSA